MFYHFLLDKFIRVCCYIMQFAPSYHLESRLQYSQGLILLTKSSRHYGEEVVLVIKKI